MPSHRGSWPFREQTAGKNQHHQGGEADLLCPTKLPHFILSLEQGGRTGEADLALTLTIILGAEEGRP